MLTISPLKRSSVAYYVRTADAVRLKAMEHGRASGGLAEYYTEHDTRVPTWLVVGDPAVGGLTGLDGAAVQGGVADSDVVTRWLDDGVAPNGRVGQRFGRRSVHGFDLTFCAPKLDF